jgi:hypothetical protein
MSDDPKLGMYQHYKGDFYRLLLLADWHEHDGSRIAVYRSLARGTVNARPTAKVGTFERDDCWTDLVVPVNLGGNVPRFRFVGAVASPAAQEARLWPVRVWLQLPTDPNMPAIECGAAEPNAVLFVRGESIPKDLDDALRQVEQARRETGAADRRVAQLEAELTRRGIALPA